MELVFVYGTLRRGHGNHVLLEKSKLGLIHIIIILIEFPTKQNPD